MTKLEILRSYEHRRIRDSWAVMGSLLATPTTTIYVKDLLYRVADPASSLFGAIVYCSQEFSAAQMGVVNWQLATLEDYAYGEISFATGIISPNFILLLTGAEFDAITEAVDTSFVPYKEEELTSSTVSISESEFNTIMTDLGAPFIRVDELEYTQQEIIDLMIKPALEEYFKWFPKVFIVNYPITTSNVVEREFPEGAYDVVHVGVTQGITNGSSNILLRYFDEVVWTAQSPMLGHVGGRKAPRSLTQDFGSMMMDRAVRQGMINYGTRIHHDTYRKDGKRYVRAYSNKMGTMQIHFAMHTLDWEDVEYARKPEARELARAYILRAFGSLRSQAKADIPGAVDYSEWVQKSNDMRKNVIDEWKDLVKYSGIIRGSM